MNLTLDKNLIDKYKNNSQKTRVISEAWTLENIFCPNCGSNIKRCPNNNPVTDFYCEKCIEDFELKSELQ